MRQLILAGMLVTALSGVAQAAAFTFNTDPFAGSTALTTAGRQIVGGEPSITFNVATDQFVFDLGAFGPYGFGPTISFANNVVGSLPTSGVNTIVLRTLDDDANAATAFGAGSAANLIAAQLTAPGAGFFIYFNSGLDLPRLVFSTDLNDNTADLKIIARMTNLAANPNGLAGFTAGNFAAVAAVPEPSALLLFGAAAALVVHRRRRQ